MAGAPYGAHDRDSRPSPFLPPGRRYGGVIRPPHQQSPGGSTSIPGRKQGRVNRSAPFFILFCREGIHSLRRITLHSHGCFTLHKMQYIIEP